MTTLCLMLKAPRPGAVKTRLARDIGGAEAAAIYRRLVERQLLEAPEGWNVEIHFTPEDAEEEMRRWLGPLRAERLEFFPQVEGDLGNRLKGALASAFPRGAECVLFAGGDCPALDRAFLTKAAAALQSSDVAIVPAIDGGYVLIGLAAQHPGIFERISWSSASVLEETTARARDLELRLVLLAPLEDVDDLPSWERARRLPGGYFG